MEDPTYIIYFWLGDDLIDLYFKLCGTNMLHKKQIIHKIYNEMTDRRETRIIYCQLNVLCSRVWVSIHTKVKFHPFFRAKSGLEGIFCWFEKEREKGSKNCLQSFTSFKGFQGGSCFMFTLQQELIHLAMGLVLQAGQFRQSTRICLATNVVFSFFFLTEMRLFRTFNFFVRSCKVALKSF